MKPGPLASDPIALRAALIHWLCPGSASAADWPRSRGPNLDGISPETNWFKPWPKDGPAALWRASVGIGFSSMTVSEGRLYTMGNTKDADTVFCFDAATGALVWRHDYAELLQPKNYEGGPGVTPTVDSDGRPLNSTHSS